MAAVFWHALMAAMHLWRMDRRYDSIQPGGQREVILRATGRGGALQKNSNGAPRRRVVYPRCLYPRFVIEAKCGQFELQKQFARDACGRGPRTPASRLP